MKDGWILLPFPPTINTYWRNLATGRTILSERGRKYKRAVADAILIQRPERFTLRQNVEAEIILYPPDKRRRDIDNYAKAILDALEGTGVLENDCIIKKISVSWALDSSGEGAKVCLKEIV